MGSYSDYRKARNAAWKTLIDCNIQSLPVDLGAVANHYGIKIVLYSKTLLVQAFSEEARTGDGFSTWDDGKHVIYLNDGIGSRYRRRFTLAHELGHILQGHVLEKLKFRNSELDNEKDGTETSANVFARDLLAPAVVLKALNLHTAKEIQDICHISYQSAEIRAERMKILYKRGAWDTHPLEPQVQAQFKNFIAKTK